MKKLIVLAFLALSMLTARTNKVDNPTPTCDPCPWVR
jgi:hypothetical protein